MLPQLEKDAEQRRQPLRAATQDAEQAEFSKLMAVPTSALRQVKAQNSAVRHPGSLCFLFSVSPVDCSEI